MDLQFSLGQISELIKRDYRVPRFAEITINSRPDIMKSPEHISMKYLLLPLLKDYEIAKKRENYAIEIMLMLLGWGNTYPYWDQPKKQKFLNEIHEALPDVRLPVMYSDDCIYNKGEIK